MKRTILATLFDVFVTLIIIAFVAVALLWFVHSFDIFELPDFIARFFGEETTVVEEAGVHEQSFLTLIENEPYFSTPYEYISLDKEKAVELLLSIYPEENYFWQVETSYTDDELTRTQVHSIYKKDNKVRVTTSEDGRDVTTIFNGNTTTTVNHTTGERKEFSGDTEFVYTNLVNIAALEHTLDSESTIIDDIALVDIDGVKYLYAKTSKNGINGSDKFFVSLDCGLVLMASSELNEVEYFKQKTVAFDFKSVISDRSFELSDSETGAQLIYK